MIFMKILYLYQLLVMGTPCMYIPFFCPLKYLLSTWLFPFLIRSITLCIMRTWFIYIMSTERTALRILLLQFHPCLLKLSEIVHVSSMDGFTVVMFKKNVMENDSVVSSKPYIGFMETKPVDFPKSVSYLPKFLDVSPKKRLVYIDIGATEHPNANLSSSSWFLPSYPIESKAFNIYIVDHNTSILLTELGITFVYHPGLAGDTNATP